MTSHDRDYVAGEDPGDQQPSSVCRCSHRRSSHYQLAHRCMRTGCGCHTYRPQAEHDERLYAMQHALAGHHEQLRAEAELDSRRHYRQPATIDPSAA